MGTLQLNKGVEEMKLCNNSVFGKTLIVPVFFLIVLLQSVCFSEKLYWSEGGWGPGKLWCANLDGSDKKYLLSSETCEYLAVALDVKAGKIYVSGKNKIQRCNLDGSSLEELVTGEFYSGGIALDLINKKIYWTSGSRPAMPSYNNKIQRANFDGSDIEVLVTRPERAEGIILDIADGKVYWTERLGNHTSWGICRSNLDGTGCELLIHGTEILGIALDKKNAKIYWTDWENKRVRRANLNGSNMQELFVGRGRPLGIVLDVRSGKIYWTEWYTNCIRTANLDGSDVKRLITTGENPWSIKLDIVPAQTTAEVPGDFASLQQTIDTVKSGVSKEAGQDTTSPPAISIESPVDFTVYQRTTTPLPHSDGKLLLTLDDITAGQVLVTLLGDDGKPVVVTRSLRQNDIMAFTVSNHVYKLKLKKLTNVLIGEDSAIFQIWPATDEVERILSEQDKVETPKKEKQLREGHSWSGFPFRRKGQKLSADIHDFIAISAGWSHSLALRSDGSIVGWGDNRWGMADPPEGNDFIAIAAGTYYGLALKSDGSIVGWGWGASGAKYPPDGNDFIAISAGSDYGLALKSDGNIVGWGDNNWGQAHPPAGNDFVAIAAGHFHSLALKSDGSTVGWGSKLDGQANAPDGDNFIAIAAGGGHSLGLKSDGSIVGWGSNTFGAANPPEGNDFVAIVAGLRYSLALKSDGSIVGWGDNGRGQARPPRGTDFVAIAAAYSHSLALKSDGSIIGWGDKLSMEQPILHRPKAKEKAKKQAKEEVKTVVEVTNASSLKAIEPPPKAIRLMVNDKINLDLIYIKPGSFTMGRDVGLGEKLISKINKLGMVGKYPDDWPARKVKITKGFYIGKYKVTSAQFCKFLNTIENPQDYVELNIFSHIEKKGEAYVSKPDCENGAINVVHWKGAVAFCDWLSHQTGLTVRLPTEAGWEFAARGPEGRSYPWGEEKNVKWAEDSARKYKKYPHPWSCAAVDAFPENVTPDGVVGMAGGVGEWCSDFYGVRYLKNDVIDPKGPTEKDLRDKSLNPFIDLDEKYHVYRSCGSGTTNRDFGDTVDGDGIYGFRIVVEQP